MISVVIPLYNKEKNIAETIGSVLKQTFQQFEIIVVNDGSADKSLEVVQSIKDSRIHIITKTNGGVSSARNKGIKATKYEYIAFLDGDDIWLPWHLQTMWQMINNYPAEDVGGYCTKIIKAKNFKEHSFDDTIKPGILITNYVKEVFGADSILSSSSFAAKKICFNDVGLFNENLSYGEDVELWYRLFTKYKLVKSDSVTALYLLYAENRSDKKIMPLTKRFHDFDFKGKSKDEKKYLGKLVSLVILDYWTQGAYNICLKIFWRYKRESYYIFLYFFKLLKKRLS